MLAYLASAGRAGPRALGHDLEASFDGAQRIVQAGRLGQTAVVAKDQVFHPLPRRGPAFGTDTASVTRLRARGRTNQKQRGETEDRSSATLRALFRPLKS